MANHHEGRQTLHAEPKKFVGGAKATMDYYAEHEFGREFGFLDYYSTPQADVVFTHVRGGLADHFELNGQLTKRQFMSVHAGRNPQTNVKEVRDGPVPVPQRDASGKRMYTYDQDKGFYAINLGRCGRIRAGC